LAVRLLAASQPMAYLTSSEAGRQRTRHMHQARCPPLPSARLASASLRYSSASVTPSICPRTRRSRPDKRGTPSRAWCPHC